MTGNLIGESTAASMRPGQLTPENSTIRWHELGLEDYKASMRPGQLTPENGDIEFRSTDPDIARIMLQ